MEGDINDRAYDPAGLNEALTILKSIKSCAPRRFNQESDEW